MHSVPSRKSNAPRVEPKSASEAVTGANAGLGRDVYAHELALIQSNDTQARQGTLPRRNQKDGPGNRIVGGITSCNSYSDTIELIRELR